MGYIRKSMISDTVCAMLMGRIDHYCSSRLGTCQTRKIALLEDFYLTPK